MKNRVAPDFDRRIAIIAAAVLLLASIGAPVGAVPVIAPEKPVHGEVMIRAEKLWAVGDDEEEVFFGYITDISTDAFGNYYVLDSRLCDVKVFDRDGNFLRTIGRKGEGPGEFNFARSLVTLPGDMIGIIQAFPAKIVTMNYEGVPADNIKPKGGGDGLFLMMSRLSGNAKNFVAGISQSGRSEDGDKPYLRPTICNIKMDGTLGKVYWTKEVMLDLHPGAVLHEGDVDTPEIRYGVGPNGDVAIIESRNDLRITIYDPAGNIKRYIDLPCSPWRRHPGASSYAKYFIEKMAKPLGINKIEVEDHEPCAVSLDWCADGNLWVRRGRAVYNHDAGVYSSYEVVTPEGEWLMTATIYLEGDGVIDRLVFVDEGRAILIQGYLESYLSYLGTNRPSDDRGPLQIQCFSLRIPDH